MRVHELAKQLGLTSKEMQVRLKELGVDIKNHMSSVDDDVVELMTEASDGTPAVEQAPVEETVKEAKAVTSPAPEAVADAPAPAETSQPPATETAEETAKPPQPVSAPALSVEERKVLKLRGGVVVKELADMLGVRPNRIISSLMKMNILASINQRIDLKDAELVALEFGYRVEHEKKAMEHKVVTGKPSLDQEEEDRPEDLEPRAPVVTFLGHVDHGKTSLLDQIRNSSVAAGESGGITQHIGAYRLEVAGHPITFLDTPGHAAFTAMRARGANLTDIAVIIIAADDGIMPQTKEAISHAKAAGVSIMVAINKCDLPAANPDRVRQQLQAEGLASEEWGGQTICCEVSAQTGAGIDHLLEMILLQAEILDLTANPRRRAQGFVIEARMETGMGPTATVLVTAGRLKVGDVMLCGCHYGRVKALINDHGVKVKQAGPSVPVKCLGLSGVPEAGAEFGVFTNEKAARNEAQKRGQDLKLEQLSQPKKASLDSLFDQMRTAGKLELRLVIKADTQGSVEAIVHSLNEIQSEKISLNILLSSTGNITGNDIMLATASDAVVLGFHVSKEPGVDSIAKREGVEVRLHSVIYELIDQVRDAMMGMLAPEFRENVIGRALVKQVFDLGKAGKVAGCVVEDGVVAADAKVRVHRADEVLYEGRIASLRHFQDTVKQVRAGQECGVRLENFVAVAEGDTLEFYRMEELAQSL